MRILSLLPLLAICGCTFGEAAGLYDVPDNAPTALVDAPFPTLLTQQQIAARNIAPLDSTAQAGENAASNALAARASALTQAEADRLHARAQTLRDAASDLPVQRPGLTADGRALLARAARLRARTS